MVKCRHLRHLDLIIMSIRGDTFICLLPTQTDNRIRLLKTEWVLDGCGAAGPFVILTQYLDPEEVTNCREISMKWVHHQRYCLQ